MVMLTYCGLLLAGMPPLVHTQRLVPAPVSTQVELAGQFPSFV